MIYEVQLFEGKERLIEPIFSCPVFVIKRMVSEKRFWNGATLFVHLKQSFADAKSDALERNGLPRSYNVL
jgi:hypothetical protein